MEGGWGNDSFPNAEAVRPRDERWNRWVPKYFAVQNIGGWSDVGVSGGRRFAGHRGFALSYPIVH